MNCYEHTFIAKQDLPSSQTKTLVNKYEDIIKKNSGKVLKTEDTNFLKPKPSIISNVTAKEETDVDKIRPLLIDQITSRVRWRESIDFMIKQGVASFLEIGPGKVLSGLVKKINRNVKISNINSIEDIIND